MAIRVTLKDESLGRVFALDFDYDFREIILISTLMDILWNPEVLGIKYAVDLILPLTEGLKYIKNNIDKFSKLSHWSQNRLSKFIAMITEYRDACEGHPFAQIQVIR